VRTAFIETLLELATKDSRVILLTADLGFTVLERFADAFPGRFVNVGVAEANMMGLATGLALDGWKPYLYSIATFASMRGYEQFRNGPVLHRLPVRLIGIGGGFAYGHAGITHFALEDYAILRSLPGLTVLSPADPGQTRKALRDTAGLPGPIYYRIGKGGNPTLPGLEGRFALSDLESVRDGTDLLLLTTGPIAPVVAEAAEDLQQQGVMAAVAVAATLHPAPKEALIRLAAQFPLVVTVEEHFIRGGLGSMAAEVLAGLPSRPRLRIIGVDEMTTGISGSMEFMRRRTGLTRDQIAAAVLEELRRPAR
jgi:transketolase